MVDRALLRRAAVQASAVVHRKLNHLRNVQSFAIGKLANLLLTTEAVRDDESVSIGYRRMGTVTRATTVLKKR